MDRAVEDADGTRRVPPRCLLLTAFNEKAAEPATHRQNVERDNRTIFLREGLGLSACENYKLLYLSLCSRFVDVFRKKPDDMAAMTMVGKSEAARVLSSDVRVMFLGPLLR
jgi:hypothetical protein